MPMAKWLILRARGQSDATPSPTGGDSAAEARPRASRSRAPTGYPGLPCDWLFSVAVEPVIIVDAATNRIVQANPAAAQLLQSSHTALVGAPLEGLFDASSAADLMRSLEVARTAGAADSLMLRSAGDGAQLRAKLSLFRSDTEAYVLVHLASGSGGGGHFDLSAADRGTAKSPVFDAIDGAAVGFLLADSGLRIEYANQAFTELVQLGSPDQALGRSLASWLDLSEGDLGQLRDQMLRRQATSVMTASLRTESNSLLEVEICAVAVPDGPHICWGFTIRELPRLN